MRKENRNRNNINNDELFLESWSGLIEYVAHDPQSIMRIECPEKDMKRLEGVLGKYKKTVIVDKGTESFKVFVKVRTKPEFELEQDVDGSKLIVALDHITDTRNLGAILRSAAFFGVKQIVVPNDRQAPITQGTLDTCQGALVYTELYSVVNLARTLKKLKEKGFWIVGTDMGGEPIHRYTNKFEQIVLVLGSEDRGLSRVVRKECDVIVSISGAEIGVESLNVSVASGIAIQQLSRPFLTI